MDRGRKIVALSFIISSIFIFLSAAIQKKTYKVVIAGFYNLENFYDTIDNYNVADEEFTPGSEKHYTTEVYQTKIAHLATVIARMGTAFSPDGPALIGVAELENGKALTDLLHHPFISERNYQFVHYDSKDARGVDVALIYNPKYFKVETSGKLFVRIPSKTNYTYYTRDILWVKGKLDNETVFVYVNHWPSRRGGEERSLPGRMAAAFTCRLHLDSVLQKEPDAKILVMGDFNDDPVSSSIVQTLKTSGNIKKLDPDQLYNPWVNLYNKGIGTLAYNDSWGLFDQLILSQSWLKKEQTGFFFYAAKVFNEEFLTENKGRYKGYPMRSWDGNNYRGGYSDHFPTFVVLLKPQRHNGTENHRDTL